MQHSLPDIAEAKCTTCARCVLVTTWSNPEDFNAPDFNSKCERQDCPINKAHAPNTIQRVEIYFVPCASDQPSGDA
jgi:hypothetical protein